MEDPFLLDKNRVESHLELMRQQFQRWRQLRDSDHQPGDQEEQEEIDEEFHSVSNELSQGVKSISWDLDDLQETLQMMLEAKAPQVAVDSDSRVAFVAKSRSFLDEVAREVAMVTKTKAASDSGGGMRTVRINVDEDVEAGEGEPPSSRPLLSWRKDTDEVSFPSVELNSLNDLRKARFHNRDWTGFFYRYRYLLGMAAAVCLIVFFTAVALAAKHTAARSAQDASAFEHAGSTAASPLTTLPVCQHWFSINCRKSTQ